MERLTDQIEALVRSSMKAGTIGGAVILVERSGETVVHHGIGRAEFDSSFELKPDSIFGMLSMTKPVTAASALILNSEGKLELEASVSRYIPEFAKPRRVRTLKPGESYPPFPPPPGAPTPPEPAYDYAPAQREITVRDLLTFTSGLQTIGVPNGAPRILPEDTLASFVAKLDSVPLEFQPGSRWHYSNATGYDVLGRVIEVASGKSFQDPIVASVSGKSPSGGSAENSSITTPPREGAAAKKAKSSRTLSTTWSSELRTEKRYW